MCLNLPLVRGGVGPLLPERHAILQFLSQGDSRPAEEATVQKPVSTHTHTLFPIICNTGAAHCPVADSAERRSLAQAFPGNRLLSAQLILVSNLLAGGVGDVGGGVLSASSSACLPS